MRRGSYRITDRGVTVLAQAPALIDKKYLDQFVESQGGKGTALLGLSGDIDGIINEDRLGLDAIYIQAKRWEGTVGRPEIMKFVGALAGQRASRGVFISTSSYTQEAREYAAQSQYKVVLIDGERLAQLMIEYNLGVSVAAVYEVKRIDNDFFVDE